MQRGRLVYNNSADVSRVMSRVGLVEMHSTVMPGLTVMETLLQAAEELAQMPPGRENGRSCCGCFWGGWLIQRARSVFRADQAG